MFLSYVESGVSLAKGADASSWYRPALALLKYNSFVILDSPETLMTYRAPLYPLYEAAMLWIGNGKVMFIIVGQIIMLWITGVFTGRIVGLFMQKYQIIALSLIVFNPNAFAIAHLIQSDTLYALFITLLVWSLLKYMVSNNELKWGAITGVFLGISCLIRPTGQYLIFLLPIIFPLINYFYGHKKIIKESVINGLVSAAISSIILLPWMAHNNEAGWGLVLVPPQIKTVYLRDNAILAESIDRNISTAIASDKIFKDEKAYVDSKIEIWTHMSDKEKFNSLVAYYGEKITSYPARVLLNSYIDSWIDFFSGGGSINFYNLLSIDRVKVLDKNQPIAHSSRMELVHDSLSGAPIQAILISALSYCYVIIIRVLGILGIIKMIKEKEYSLLLIIIGLIMYFAMTALFVGNSRYRLPVEIGFIVLALYGLLFLNDKKIKQINKMNQNKILIFIVAYNAESHIESVLDRIPRDFLNDNKNNIEILIVDDSSVDNTVNLSNKYVIENSELPITVFKNPENQGYGGNQKIGYLYMLKNNFDIVILLHGDGQYAPEYIPILVDPVLKGEADAVFGSRMINKKDALKGGMPLYKYFGNQILTFIQNKLLHSNLYEFHSGYRIYSSNIIKKIPFQFNSNDFDFDTDIIIQIVDNGFKIQELSIPTFYGDEICNVNGIKYAWNILKSTTLSRIQHKAQLFYSPKFDYEEDNNIYTDKTAFDSSHKFAIDRVNKNSIVFDIGAGPGVIARELFKKSCVIYGVDEYIQDSLVVSCKNTQEVDLDFIEKSVFEF